MTRVEDLLPGALADLLPDEMTARRANWIEVARKDVADAGRSWLVYALCGLFMGVLLVAATVHALDPRRRTARRRRWTLHSDSIPWSG